MPSVLGPYMGLPRVLRGALRLPVHPSAQVSPQLHHRTAARCSAGLLAAVWAMPFQALLLAAPLAGR